MVFYSLAIHLSSNNLHPSKFTAYTSLSANVFSPVPDGCPLDGMFLKVKKKSLLNCIHLIHEGKKYVPAS